MNGSLNIWLKTREKWFPYAGALIYALAIIFLSAHHEVWRDEVHHLSIVTESQTFPELFKNFAPEGCSFIWYLALSAAYALVPSMMVLKAVTILSMTAAVFLFFRFAPFSWLEKILFSAGYFICYEYAVINRSYGLSLPLWMLAAIFYRDRGTRIEPLAVTLFLLANIDVHCFILVGSLFFCLHLEWFWQYFLGKEGWNHNRVFWGFILIGLGMALGFILMVPDPNTGILNGPPDLSWARIIQNLRRWGVSPPSELFKHSFGQEETSFLTLAFGIFLMGSLRRPFQGLWFWAGFVGLSLFFELVCYGYLRHQGYLWILMMLVLWIEKNEDSKKPENVDGGGWNHFFLFFEPLRRAVFLILLVMQVGTAYPAVVREIQRPFSSSKEFSEWIRRTPQYRDAIIVSEPDFSAEPLVYYIQNPIYFPRENRFGKYVNFTKANAQSLSLGELVGKARQLKAQMRKPVLIMLAHYLKPEAPYEIRFGYEKRFTYSPEELKMLETQTKHVAAFTKSFNVTDENYEVYEVL